MEKYNIPWKSNLPARSLVIVKFSYSYTLTVPAEITATAFNFTPIWMYETPVCVECYFLLILRWFWETAQIFNKWKRRVSINDTLFSPEVLVHRIF